MSYQIKSLSNRLIFNKYKVIKRIGKGSFGYVYLVRYNNKHYAMKFEDTEKGYYILEKEYYLMDYLYGPRIPYIKGYGQYGKFNVLIMEILGKSLEDILEILPNKKMSIQCVCKLAYQMIQILEHIHKKYFVHRDIKPSNFIMGIGPNSKFVYIIDLGFAKTYKNPKTLEHVPLTKGGITGTSRYASINALKGYTQSRRDDLESLAYSIIHLSTGTLPWINIKRNDKDSLNKEILRVKEESSSKSLCVGLPPQFETFVDYVRNMNFEQEPDYKYLKNLFLNALLVNGGKMDYAYDWENNINDENLLPIIKNNNINNNYINYNIEDNKCISIEKIFNSEDILKKKYEYQKNFSIKAGIYIDNEINQSGIEPYPMEIQSLEESQKKQRLKEPGCNCCLII